MFRVFYAIKNWVLRPNGGDMEKFSIINPLSFKKPKRHVFRVFIHCSASDNPKHDDPRVIEAWHKQRNFKEIGYHFFISKNGNIHVGRDLEKVPAAQAGNNTNTIAICVHGLLEGNFTKDQKAALQALCGQINREYHGSVTFHGHCEVAAKDCPVFDYKEWLKLDKHGRLGFNI